MQTTLCLEGIFSAQWLPFLANGRLDHASLAAHVNFERRCGVRGILALGSTAGFPYLSPAERIEALAALAGHARDMTLIANVTDIRPQVAIEVGLAARELGYGAIALMPPIFYPISQGDILAYFMHVAKAVALPVVLYNFPELTGKRIELETVAAFADSALMVGIKQSGGDFEYHIPLVKLGREKGFSVATGSDLRLPEAFSLGVSACIGGLVNILPELMVRLFSTRGQSLEGESKLAFERMREVGAIINDLNFPLSVAAAMEARDLVAGSHMAVVSEATEVIYAGVVARLRSRFAEWGIQSALGSTIAAAHGDVGKPIPQ